MKSRVNPPGDIVFGRTEENNTKSLALDIDVLWRSFLAYIRVTDVRGAH